LPDAIDAAGSLLQPRRAPRQFEMNDGATAEVKVQALRRGIGREQQRPGTVETVLRGDPFPCGHSAVQRRDWPAEIAERRLKPGERVAEFSKDDDWFLDATDEATQVRDLGFGPGRVLGRGNDRVEPALFCRRIRQPRDAKEQ